MKFFLAFALIVAVASAKNVPVTTAEQAEIQEIIAAIQSPSTDPATAAALEQMLHDILGTGPVSVGPAIVDEFEPIIVGPAIVDEFESIHVGPEVVDFPISEVQPTPVAPMPVAPAPAADTPLVQIILNINSNVAGNPVTVDTVNVPVAPIVPEVQPTPVSVAEQPIAVEVAGTPVQVVDQPIQIVELPEIEAVQVGQPILPAPAVVLPEILN